ncbi:MAG: hypothetical protein C0392_00230 [Syntrophus sp. (in: bacteria)]|nr:hypothetical protein [Syntrophus sp. (in: bacteria)]
MSEKIVIIEDDGGVRFFLEEALRGEGYRVFSYESYEAFLSKLDRTVDLLIMDINLPGMDGLSAIDDLKKKIIAPILIITAYGTKKNAMEAISKGATDFFVKPIPLDELKIMVRRVLGKKRLIEEIDLLKEEQFTSHSFHGVLGKSEQMKEIFRTVEKIAEKDLTVLITGETGVGKEEIANLIHVLSKRKGDLVVVNCASIPDALLESELFGYEKGAFTGAVQQKLGKMEIADKGTVVLDEIGEMTPSLQAKLLRVVEKKEIERLGSTKKRVVDVRIISTTNRILEDEIARGRFRDDLYYRLSQIRIHVPPLRDRSDDADVLLDAVLSGFGKESGIVLKISDDARQRLRGYKWPGNVRELINVLKKAAIMCEGDEITIDDLPLHLQGDYVLDTQDYSDRTLEEAIAALEKRMILDALKKTDGSQVNAARLLGISERSMWYRIKKYGIEAK